MEIYEGSIAYIVVITEAWLIMASDETILGDKGIPYSFSLSQFWSEGRSGGTRVSDRAVREKKRERERVTSRYRTIYETGWIAWVGRETPKDLRHSACECADFVRDAMAFSYKLKARDQQQMVTEDSIWKKYLGIPKTTKNPCTQKFKVTVLNEARKNTKEIDIFFMLLWKFKCNRKYWNGNFKESHKTISITICSK